MEDVEITDNIAFDGYGGGLKGTNQNVTMSRVLFRNNTAKMSGGAISFESDSVVTITSCSLIDNTAGSNGGALLADGQVPSKHDRARERGRA
jgi:predicted outer membrane repeat protein